MKGVACSRALQSAALYYVGSYSSHIHKLHKSSSPSLSPVFHLLSAFPSAPPSAPPCLLLSPARLFSFSPRIFYFFSSHPSVPVAPCLPSLSSPLYVPPRCHSSRRRRTSDRWLSRRNSFPHEGIRLIAVIGKSLRHYALFLSPLFRRRFASPRREKLASARRVARPTRFFSYFPLLYPRRPFPLLSPRCNYLSPIPSSPAKRRTLWLRKLINGNVSR